MITQILNSWQLNLVFYLVFAVSFMQFYKLAVKNIKKDGVATILLQFIGGLSILLLTPFFSFTLSKNPTVYLFLTIACIFYALNDRLQTTVRKNLPVSVFTILSQLTGFFVIMYGIFIFKEPIFLTKILGAFLIIGANIFLFYEKGKLDLNKDVLLGILASFFLATAISIDIGISSQFNLPFYIMFTLVIPASMILLVEKIKPSQVLKEFKTSKERKYYLLTGISWGLLIFFMLRAYRFGAVITITTLSATTVF
jgi:drug/metabolite transporter (DMT)-like permease